MGKKLPNRIRHLFFGPFGMLALQEGGFVPAHGPIELARRLPALLWRHATEDGNLFRTGLFICQHGDSVITRCDRASGNGWPASEYYLPS